ncbi:MAG: formate dehydrogenase accessory sulfurtransferase FdhD, partial [Isosphaeraceae bacterium]
MTRACHRTGVASVPVGRVTGSLSLPASDELSVEEPLEIRVAKSSDGSPPMPIAVTMRTPGDDVELAAGFLFTEGIISGLDDLEAVERKGPNAVKARLQPGIALEPAKLDRHSFVSSSCGACGKRSIAAVR